MKEQVKEQVIDAKRLLYFSKVFKRGSLNAVADELDMAQAGIGRQIALLERELGMLLFERGTNGRGMVPSGHGRGMVPTEAAQLVYDYCRKNRDDQEKLKVALQEMKEMKRGEISIAMPSPYIDGLMEEIFNDFYHEHPSLKINIEGIDDSSQIITKVLHDDVQIGIVRGDNDIPDIRCHARALLPMCALVNQHHPLSARKRVEFAEIARYPFLLPPSSNSIWRILNQVARSEKAELTSPLIIDSAVSRKKAAINGHGGVLMSTIATRQEIEANQLISVEIDHPAFTTMEVGLIVRQSRLLSPATNQLLRLIKGRSSLFEYRTLGPISENRPSVSLPHAV